MKNITVTLDDETAKWVRVKSAEHGKSVSRYLGDLLHEHMKERVAYQRAMERFLSKPPYKIREPGDPFPKREDLYVRPRVR